MNYFEYLQDLENYKTRDILIGSGVHSMRAGSTEEIKEIFEVLSKDWTSDVALNIKQSRDTASRLVELTTEESRFSDVYTHRHFKHGLDFLLGQMEDLAGDLGVTLEEEQE